MADQREIDALSQIREHQEKSRKLAQIVFISTIVLSSLILVITPQLGSRFVMQIITVLAGISIFGLVFPRRVGLILAKQKYKKLRPHKRLLEFTDPDDIEVSVEEALQRIHEKQEKELLKYRR